METVSDGVKESKNEDANEEVVNEVNEEASEETPKQEVPPQIEEASKNWKRTGRSQAESKT